MPVRPTRRIAAALALAFATAPVAAHAAGPDLASAWTLVRADNIAPDGTRTALYGPAPEGSLMFDGQGRYAIQIARPGRPAFAAGDKAKGTAEEYRAASLGYNAHFGRYEIVGKVLTFRIERASFPNWEGQVQARDFSLQGDRLTYRVPAPTSGAGAVGEVEWWRVRPD